MFMLLPRSSRVSLALPCWPISRPGRPSTSSLVWRPRLLGSFAAAAGNQRGSSPISGTSRAAGGPTTVLGHHPMTKPNAMAVRPINNISQSGHHRLITRLRNDIAADPLLPPIGRCCRQLEGAADRSSSHGMVRMSGVWHPDGPADPPLKVCPFLCGEAMFRGLRRARSAKTRSVAKMAVIRTMIWATEGREEIVLCGREFMNSLADNSFAEVRRLLAPNRGLPRLRCRRTYIRTKCRRICFAFRCLRHNWTASSRSENSPAVGR
jgi:hypothetical protein